MNRKIIFTIAPFAVVASTLVGCKKQATKVTSITATSAKTTYMKDDAINKNDIVVEATYDTGDKQKITGWQCDDFNEDNNYVYKFDTGGSKTFNIKYSNCETSIKFNVASIVTKAEWLDVYEGIYNNFQNSTKEYMTHNIASFIYGDATYLQPYSYQYTNAGTRIFKAILLVKIGEQQYATYTQTASVQFTKTQLNSYLKDENQPGIKYLISDDCITYSDENASTTSSFKNLSYNKDGYLLDQYMGNNNRIRVQYSGQFRDKPNSVTSGEWKTKYQDASEKFQKSNERYTKSDISVKGYIMRDEQSHAINAKVCNFNSYIYKKDDSNFREFFVTCEKENQEGTMVRLAGGKLECATLYSKIQTYSQVCDVDYYVGAAKNLTRVLLYLKTDGSLFADLIFNSDGYCERYYWKGEADLTITYKNNALSDCEELYPCGLMTSKIGEQVVSYGHAFSDFKDPVTFSLGKKYLFTCVVEPIYDDKTKKYISFGVEKLCFTNSSGETILTTNNIESLKAYTTINGVKKNVNVSLTANGEIKLENEIKTQGTEITFEFTTKAELSALKIYSTGTTL